MELYCRRCTRAETIKGDMDAAKAAGWQVDSWPEGDQFVCPRCPAIRTKPQLSIEETYLAAGQILHDLSLPENAKFTGLPLDVVRNVGSNI